MLNWSVAETTMVTSTLAETEDGRVMDDGKESKETKGWEGNWVRRHSPGESARLCALLGHFSGLPARAGPGATVEGRCTEYRPPITTLDPFGLKRLGPRAGTQNLLPNRWIIPWSNDTPPDISEMRKTALEDRAQAERPTCGKDCQNCACLAAPCASQGPRLPPSGGGLLERAGLCVSPRGGRRGLRQHQPNSQVSAF